MPPDRHRPLKDRLYGQLGRIGKALASPHRLEILHLLAQGQRTVHSLATETGLSLANLSQHWQGSRRTAPSNWSGATDAAPGACWRAFPSGAPRGFLLRAASNLERHNDLPSLLL